VYTLFVDRHLAADGLDNMPNYIVRIRTGSQTPVHADDTNISTIVSIVCIDPINDSIRIPLERTSNCLRAPFQAGQEDQFDIFIPSMGDVST
jgi:hypothetical protein